MNAVRSRNQLIVTADDFGMSSEVNEAVEIAHRTGILSAASLMVAGPAAADAVRRARRMPDLRVGLHVVLVDGSAASPPERIPALVGADGRLRSDLIRTALSIAISRRAAKQMSDEIIAQHEAFRATGLELDHVNSHKHFHLHPFVAAAILDIGRRYGVRAMRVPDEPWAVLEKAMGDRPPASARLLKPWNWLLRAKARRAGVATPDAVFGLQWSGAMSARRLVALLKNLPPGLVEIYLHPATSDAFDGHAPGYRYREELAALCDPACLDAVRRLGRAVGGYADAVSAGPVADSRLTER